MNAIVLLVLGVLPQPSPVVEDAFQTFELNHRYDDNGKHLYDQILFYDQDDRIQDYRLVKSPDQIPQRDRQRGGFRILWKDLNALRLVRAVEFKETWTQHDPEETGDPSPERRQAARRLLKGTYRTPPAVIECECEDWFR